MRKGETVEGTVETLVYGGRGLIRDDGFVVFVDGVLPGDRVACEVTRAKRGYAEARATDLLDPSPARIPPQDVHQGEPCPGAPWQSLEYDGQLAFKQEQALDAMTRLGGLDGFEFEPILAADEKWRYRNKVEYSFGSRDGEVELGFRPRGRWDEVLQIEDCLLSPDRTNRARNEVLKWARETGLSAWDPRRKEGTLRNLVIREGRRTGQVQTRLVTSPDRIPRPPVDLHTVIEGPSGGTDGPTGVLGEEYLTEEICGLKVRMSYDSFFQTNTEMAEQLYRVVSEYAGLSGEETVFDLYCGIGTIGLMLARDAGKVYGLEIVPGAIENARENARQNGITNAEFVAGNARTGLRPLLEQAGRPGLVVLDPPRAGLSAKIVRRVIECEASRIVYVSCNPTTLAPNAAQLVEAGYRLVKMRPVDMFPQTPHIECVALFEKEVGR